MKSREIQPSDECTCGHTRGSHDKTIIIEEQAHHNTCDSCMCRKFLQKSFIEAIREDNQKRRREEVLARAQKALESEKPIELTEDLTKEISFEELGSVLDTTIKSDFAAKVITFCGMLNAQTDNDQFNVAFQSASSTGKSHIALETAAYFPHDEIEEIAYASPASLFHDNAVWDKNSKLLLRSFERKILILIDMPHWQLLARLRPILSHDKKELLFKITDKSEKFGLRTKTVCIRGFASVFFATTSHNNDEQEQTRMFIVSPTVSQQKLKKTIEQAAFKNSNVSEYRVKILEDPKRIWLIRRVKAIRQTEIREVIIPDEGKAVFEVFINQHPDLQARHQRDIVRIIALIKAHALLNCFHREDISNGLGNKRKTIVATSKDIAAGFDLYKEIEPSNILGLSPYAFEIFETVIKPNFAESGLTQKTVRQEFYKHYHRILDSNTEKALISQYESAGLIELFPDPDDKRRRLIYPTVHTNISPTRRPDHLVNTDKYNDIDSGVSAERASTKSPSTIKCPYSPCNFSGASEEEVIAHGCRVHPRKPITEDLAKLKDHSPM